jgi:hypothetical protein
MFPITRATEIQKPMCRGEEEEEEEEEEAEVEGGEEGRETADGADGPEELEKEGSVGTVIRPDSSTGSDLDFLGPIVDPRKSRSDPADAERGWQVRQSRTRPAPSKSATR